METDSTLDLDTEAIDTLESSTELICELAAIKLKIGGKKFYNSWLQ